MGRRGGEGKRKGAGLEGPPISCWHRPPGELIRHWRRWFKLLVSRYFRRSYLKTNKVSKSEGIRKLKYVYHF